MNEYFPIHLHSMFSLGDAAATIDEYINEVKRLKLPGATITEHGNLASTFEFYNKFKKANLKPVIGIEAYVVDKYPEKWNKEEYKKRYHLTILVKNEKGWKNLLKLQHIASTKGFYYKPNYSLEEIIKYKDGLIILTACINGILNKDILSNNIDNAIKKTILLKKEFKDNLYLEVMPHYMLEKQIIANKKIVEISKKYNIPIVATLDAHYAKKEDVIIRKAIKAIGMKKLLKEITDEESYYIRDYNTFLQDLIKAGLNDIDAKNALINTFNIGMNINFELKNHDPKTTIPKISNNPLKDIVNIIKKHPEYKTFNKKRIITELKRIESKGFSNYFLIVKKIMDKVKELKIQESAGRGSIGGSLIAYLMNIHKANPIKYGLNFDRFLAENREEMPDIDMDFPATKREKLLFSFLKDLYSNNYEEHFSKITAFSYWHKKGALRDVGRILEINIKEIDRLTKLIINDKWKDLLTSKFGKNFVKQNKDMIILAKKLENRIRHFTVHAAGVLLTNKPIYNYIPVYKINGLLVSAWEKKQLEKYGLVKFDFLGLSTLDVIDLTLKTIKKTKNKTIALPLEFNDKQVYDNIFKNGNTLGIFQFETPGMIKYLREYKVFTSFDDLNALNTLARPGAKQFLPQYANIIGKKIKPKYAHKILEPILKSTYGLILYQEQVMQIGELGGIDGNKMRKIDKLTPTEMKEVEIKFIKNMIKKGVDKKIAQKIIKQVKEFAKYSFNKAHSVEYTIISYWTGWLKNYYTPEFLVSLLNLENDDKKIKKYLKEIKKYNIKLLPPDINDSNYYHTLYYINNEPVIVLGFNIVKGFGDKIIEKIIKNQPFNNIFQIAKTMKKSKTLMLGAIQALNKFIPSYKWLEENIDDIIKNKKINIPENYEEYNKTILNKNFKQYINI